MLYADKKVHPALGRYRLEADLDARGLAPETVHDVAMFPHEVLADAVEDGLLARNPADGAHSLPRDRVASMRTWSAERVRSFLAHVDGDRPAALWRLAATAGMRSGEVLGLRRRDVDLEGGTVSVAQARVRGAEGLAYGPPKTSAGRRRIDIDQGHGGRGTGPSGPPERGVGGAASRR